MIDLQNVYKIYETGDTTVHALDGMSLHVDEGEFVAIVGQSGSRKIYLYEYYRLLRYANIRTIYFRWLRCKYFV